MDEIFYLTRHGGGGFTWIDCYNMPTQVRKYNVRKLSAEIKEENERREAAAKGESQTSTLDKLASGNIKGFQKPPDYKAKAPNKR